MSTARILAWACFVLITFGIPARGDDEQLKALAEYYKDKRDLKQIKLDNEMILAAAKGEVEKVREALSNGALVNSRYLDDQAFLDAGASGYTALMLACRNQKMDVIKLLIESKADLDLKNAGRSSLYRAVWNDKADVVELLVKAGAKEDAAKIRQTRDLLRAACRGYSSAQDSQPPYPGPLRFLGGPSLEEALKTGVDVNSADCEGYTALMYASNLGQVENVKLLLAHGADPTLKVGNRSAITMADARAGMDENDPFRQIHELLLVAKSAK